MKRLKFLFWKMELCSCLWIKRSRWCYEYNYKKGQEGKSKITYNGSIGASMNANFPQFMNGPQFAYYYNMADMMDKMANGSISTLVNIIPFLQRRMWKLC
ncbi:hypothetical protein NXV63_29075 [Bacteroides xylanisolvens]|nr:hypothetical protein [Bacteroides xylanisolvens]